MTHEEAAKWAEKNYFFYYSFKTRDDPGHPGYPTTPASPTSPGHPGIDTRPPTEGRTLWDVSGFAWKKDRRAKVRIHQVDEKLEVAMDRVKSRFEEVGTW